jgi:PEGA domain
MRGPTQSIRSSITMSYVRVVVLMLLSATFVLGQAPTSGGCGKNVSFAIAENGQPVPAIPKFTLKWLSSKTRQETFGGLCFSQVPSTSETNYIVVFSTNPNAFDGLKASAHTYKASPQSDPTASGSGGTWSYAYTGAAPSATTDTLDLRRDDKPKTLVVRAYDQSGRTVSQGNLNSFSSREKLLEKMLSDILKDTPSPETKKYLTSALSVYYVNCDVDGQPVSPSIEQPVRASLTTAAPAPAVTAPVPPPQPKPELQIWSYPAGADVFLDGSYVGQTPYSVEVAPGQHTIDLRKKNFGIWQRRITAMSGTRKIGGNLEQKVLNLQ